jgi:hypothetical protein
MIEHLSRDEKKALIEKLHVSIIRMQERRIRKLKREGKNIRAVLTPMEISQYRKDTGNYFEVL